MVGSNTLDVLVIMDNGGINNFGFEALTTIFQREEEFNPGTTRGYKLQNFFFETGMRILSTNLKNYKIAHKSWNNNIRERSKHRNMSYFDYRGGNTQFQSAQVDDTSLHIGVGY